MSVTDGSLTGWGEMAPGATEGAADVAEGQAQLEGFFAEGLKGAIHDIWQAAHAGGVGACALAALDMALWDLRAKQAGMPLYKLLGLARQGVVSSLTVGFNPSEVARERVPLLLTRGARAQDHAGQHGRD